jgi:hypothetical protein
MDVTALFGDFHLFRHMVINPRQKNSEAFFTVTRNY